jgi:uncharacterized protein YbaP (TraB family)
MRFLAIGLLAASIAATSPVFAGASALRTTPDGPARLAPPTMKARPAKPDAIEATPAMWVVHGPKGTAYLLGSIHYLPKNVHWQTPEIAAAMKRADTFVFEVPMDDDNAWSQYPKDMLLPLDLSLPSFFDQQMRDDYQHVIFRIHGNPDGLVYLRPWVAAQQIQAQAYGIENVKGLSLDEGVDHKVYEAAKARGAKVRAFETVALHIQLLTDNGNIDEGMAELRRTLKSLLAETSDQTAQQRLFDAWYRGDIKALAVSSADTLKQMPPAGRKALLEDRNRAWIPQIAAMLNEKHTYFITVGAAHLVGKIGVPALLRQQGFRVDGPDAGVSANAGNLRAF